MNGLEQKTAEGFKAAGERMDNLTSNVEEIGEAVNMLMKRIKLVGHAVNGDDGYNGFWPNAEMAKDFGSVVMEVVGLKCEKDMDTITDSGGGAMVPEELARWIIQKLGKYGKFRKFATEVPLGTSMQRIPRICSDLAVFVPGEGKTITKSDIVLDTVMLMVKKFACITAISRELDEDTIGGIGEIVAISIVRSMARKEDLIGFLGDGTVTYFGMTGICGSLRKVASSVDDIAGLIETADSTYASVTLAVLRQLVGLLPEEADEDAKWFMNRKFYYNTIYPLAETAGLANVFEILSNQKGRFLLGYPVEFVSCMPSTAAAGQIPVVLGDLSIGAFLGTRSSLVIERSTDVFFESDQMGIRGIERVDINAYGVGDASEPGPIVGLMLKE